jgi:hypothetical protein
VYENYIAQRIPVPAPADCPRRAPWRGHRADGTPLPQQCGTDPKLRGPATGGAAGGFAAASSPAQDRPPPPASAGQHEQRT